MAELSHGLCPSGVARVVCKLVERADGPNGKSRATYTVHDAEIVA